MQLSFPYLYYFLFFSTLIISCQPDKEEVFQTDIEVPPANTIDLNLDIESEEKLNLSNFLTDVSFIPLQTTEESLLSYITKILVVKDRFMVFDPGQSSIKAFSKQGEHLFSIKKLGNGPGEYTSLDDVNVYPNNTSLSLFSLNSQKLIFYDWEGNFQKESRITFYGLSFSWLSKNELALFANYSWNSAGLNNKLYTAELSGKVLHRYFPYPENMEIASTAVSGFLYQNGRYSLFSEPYLDSIYQLSTTHIYPKYAFNFGNYQMPRELFESNDNDKFLEHAFDYSFLLPGVAENEQGLIFSYIHEKLDNWGIYDPRSKRLIRKVDLIEDLWEAAFWVPVGKMPDGRFIVAIQPSQIKKLQEKKGALLDWNSPENQVFKEVFERLGENDNPVLMLFNLHTD